MKKISLLVFTAVLTFSFLDLGGSVLAEEDLSEIQKEFEENIEKGIDEESGEAKEGLEKFYIQYNDLDEGEKKQFVEYISSEEIMEKAILDTDSDIEITSSEDEVSLIKDDSNSDLPEGVEVETTLASARAATYTKTVKLLGINMMKHKSKVKYDRTKAGGTITDAYGGDHYMSQNFTLNSAEYTGKYTRHTKKLPTLELICHCL